MLSSLTLSNVALIKKQTIEFKNGFNCLLGQSGAGKSIIIDALSFSLGARTDKNLIRSGENVMRVDAVFVDVSNDVKKLMEEWEIDFDDEMVVTRSLSIDGKSSIKVNGFPITVKMLKELAEKLADFCGQHDSVGLLQTSNHLMLLDKFSGKAIEEKKEKVFQAYNLLLEINNKIASLGGSELERAREKEILEFQISEIENANLQVGEEEELKERFNYISSSEKIHEKVGEVLDKLDVQRDNVAMLLHDSKTALSSLSDFKEIGECKERIENCYYEIKDIVDVLETIKDNTDFDEKELERLDERLDLIKTLSKKYGKSIEDILAFKEDCQNKLDVLENSQEILDKLKVEQAKCQSELENACSELSDLRKKYAVEFEKQIMSELDDLQMKGTHFKINFEKCECSKKGCDDVKFMFSANKGQDIKDLHKTASGGELSRLLLAFKNVMLDREKVQTIVFDEIDAGISGHTAGKVAEKLVNISKFTQIICITHTAVVAAKADEFLLVEKSVVDNSTISKVSSLEKEQAIKEVARLIDGGVDISETAIEHAKKLFN